MTDKPTKYVCAVCGKAYDSITERNECETKCLKTFRKQERQKTDTIAIKKLFYHYIEYLNQCADIVSMIDAETEAYFSKYGLVFADRDVCYQLCKFLYDDKEYLKPNLLKQGKSTYVSDEALQKFDTYSESIKDNTASDVKSNIDIEAIQKAVREDNMEFSEELENFYSSVTSDDVKSVNNNEDKTNSNFKVRIRKFKLK